MASGDSQIEQMVGFIMNEAKEKVNEIHLRTTHDANLERQMQVHNAKTKMQKEFADREKQIKMNQRVKISRAEADFRRQKMEVRANLLDGVKQQAIEGLKSLTSNSSEYKNMLRDLVVQGLIKLNESHVEVIVRESDSNLAKEILSDAESKYVETIKNATGQTPNIKLELNPNGKCLPPAPDGSGKKSCAGGVKLLAVGGKVICDNTLDSRLRTAFNDLMPSIRKTLFSTRV